MNTSPIDVFALAEKRMAWAGQRQNVLAHNIANANTPGYAARDVKAFKDVLAAQHKQEAGGVILASTRPPGSLDRTNAAKSLDGNAVVLDEQMEKVAETDGAHQLAMGLYKKYAGMFKTAIGRN